VTMHDAAAKHSLRDGGGRAVTPRRKEIAIVALMALGFGLVGIDRFLITTMFPTIAKDLHLSYEDIGTVTGALAVAWGLSALVVGNLSDRIGRRRVLVGSLILFSLLIGTSGLATGLAGLVVFRLFMGIADGAYTPASITATIEHSSPEHHGVNIGIQQMMLPLFGLGIGPLLVSQLLNYVTWRWIFTLFILPGLVLAYYVWRKLPPPSPPQTQNAIRRSSWADWRAVLAIRNIRIGALMMLCWLTCLMTTSAFLPNYLLDHLHLTFMQMAQVMSSIGIGATCGTVLLPWLSDKVGRKRVMILSALGALAGLLGLVFVATSVGGLFIAVFIVHFFNNPLITLTVGPLCQESAPIGLAATASGLVIAVAELFGGGLAPALAGWLAMRFGINCILWPPIVMMGVGIVLASIIDETYGPQCRANR